MGSLTNMPDPTDTLRQTRKRRSRRGGRVSIATITAELKAGATVALLLFGAGSGWYLITRASGFQSDELAVKHLASATSCDVGEIIGMAPSGRGQAGYWPHLDADHDGVACETIDVKGVLVKGR
jgi:hypothetical protein